MNHKRTILINLVFTFVLFELISAIFFRRQVRIIYSNYLEFQNFSPFPKDYFVANENYGFDIKNNSPEKLISNAPSEAKTYKIFSNSYGCFDKRNNYNFDNLVYLAGDSFTWGYSPYEKKFGTLLEKKLNIPIAKCGVTGTGQIQQFKKFERISKSIKRYPSKVIVNIFANDIEDDFLYPSATVINGYLVRKAYYEINKMPKIGFFSDKELEDKFRKWRVKSVLNPKRYSSLISTFDYFLKNLLLAKKTSKKKYLNNIELLNFSHKNISSDEQIAKNNLEAIKEWIKHSKVNNYNLKFLLISRKYSNSDYYLEFKKKLKIFNAEFYDFDDYIKKNRFKKDELYWSRDGHFNIKGNLIYSKFIEKIINN